MEFGVRHVQSGAKLVAKVTAAGGLSLTEAAAPPGDVADDGLWISPGWVDIQVNGYRGVDLNVEELEPDAVHELVRVLWAEGVTAFCPTIVTQSRERFERAVRAIAAACEADPLTAKSVAAIHLEGPYISPVDGPRGAHPLEHVRAPDLAEFARWQEASGGRVGLITLAPEQPGSIDFIRAVSAQGVVVSLGHTEADTETLAAAAAAGARLSTHLGNGAHAMIPRHPNYIWDQLADDRLMASFIFDTHHLPPAVMKAMLRAKGLERAILVSDSVAAGGLGPGVYETAIGGKVELLPSGRLNLLGTPYLAGSASCLREGIGHATRYTGIDLAAAVRLATANPARLLGQSRNNDWVIFRFGPADAVPVVEATIVDGQLVYSRNEGVVA